MSKIDHIRRIMLACFLMLAAALPTVAFAGDGTALEVVISRPKAGSTLEQLLAADKKMEQDFASKQKGFISREVAVSKDGEVIVIVHWATLADAEAAGAIFMSDPAAKPRLDISDASLFKHYVVQ